MDKGKHLAHGKSKQMVTSGLQSISQAATAMGYLKELQKGYRNQSWWIKP